MVKKIGLITGTRAEYGLLEPLLSKISEDKGLELLLFVTGTHLSPEFGMTVDQIEADGYRITDRIEILLSSDSPSGITKAVGLELIGLADSFMRNKPDLLIILGDRFEAMGAAMAALIARIPIAHIHGGELTEGAIDDSIRHSISKMAQYHFVSTEEYRRRVIQLGESPNRVHTVGAFGIDLIERARFASRAELVERLPVLLGRDKIFLVTLHPETRSEGSSRELAYALSSALDGFQDAAVVITGANADAEGRAINDLWSRYCESRENSVFVPSLGSYLFLGLMRETAVVVGNSSSGILEAPAMGVPSVDIGNRQQGRVSPSSVIHCGRTATEIETAIRKALEAGPRADDPLKGNPYWHGGAAGKVYSFLKSASEFDFRKRFHDIAFDVR